MIFSAQGDDKPSLYSIRAVLKNCFKFKVCRVQTMPFSCKNAIFENNFSTSIFSFFFDNPYCIVLSGWVIRKLCSCDFIVISFSLFIQFSTP